MRWMLLLVALGPAWQAAAQPLGLPPVPVPEHNPQSPEKVALGERLFNDVRFSSTGAVSCANCHAAATVFTDALPVSVGVGIDGLTGTRNAPTVVNAAYNATQFWDGRSPSLEDQALHPFLNPVEMAMPTHDALLEIIRADREYTRAFRDVFDTRPEEIRIDHVTKAIAAFERTQIAGDSPFDRWYFGGEEGAISDAAKRGFDVFLTDGRCVSCHMIEQDHAGRIHGRGSRALGSAVRGSRAGGSAALDEPRARHERRRLRSVPSERREHAPGDLSEVPEAARPRRPDVGDGELVHP